MADIIATPASPLANSYATLEEVQAYIDARIPLAGWDDAEAQDALVIMATRTLDMMAQGRRTLVMSGGVPAYYRVSRKWTGSPATTTQRLAWPRIGMYDQNGNAIDPTSIPQALKDAVAEFAGQLSGGDRTLDNDVIVQGLTSVKAGSVSLAFKDNIMPQVIPDAVFNLLPASWLTDELYEPALGAQFEVL
jgi:hypothetical protein